MKEFLDSLTRNELIISFGSLSSTCSPADAFTFDEYDRCREDWGLTVNEFLDLKILCDVIPGDEGSYKWDLTCGSRVNQRSTPRRNILYAIANL